MGDSAFRGDGSIGRLVLGTTVGAFVGILALFLAFISAGAGHGDYIAARALFPVPMLTTLAESDSIGPVSMALGLGQFPLYGAFVGLFSKRIVITVCALAALHIIAALVAFSGALPNFS